MSADRGRVMTMTLFSEVCRSEVVKLYSVVDTRGHYDRPRESIRQSYRVAVWLHGHTYGHAVVTRDNYEDALTCYEEEVLAMLARWDSTASFSSIG